jgi:hypothetical protein
VGAGWLNEKALKSTNDGSGVGRNEYVDEGVDEEENGEGGLNTAESDSKSCNQCSWDWGAGAGAGAGGEGCLVGWELEARIRREEETGFGLGEGSAASGMGTDDERRRYCLAVRGVSNRVTISGT